LAVRALHDAFQLDQSEVKEEKWSAINGQWPMVIGNW
jgi:hypothetical protein